MYHSITKQTKEKLLSIIKEMGENPSLFVRNPGVDFTRKKKMDFESFLKFFISMGGSSLKKEIYEFYSFSPDTLTVSAFNQQRAKVLPEAFEFLFHEFTKSLTYPACYNGYHLLACDGSSLNISKNPMDFDTYSQNQYGGSNLLHLNALYHLGQRTYVDATIQNLRQKNECQALIDMIQRSPFPDNTILICDRYYERYNVLAHLENKGWDYVVRAKDIDSNGIVSAFKFPDCAFDIEVELLLTRRRTKEMRTHPEKYRTIAKKSKFDFFDEDKSKPYPIKFRILRFELSENKYECLITSLDKDTFSTDDLKQLYRERWGIETGFRELKYAIGLVSFHARKKEYIKQEVFARLVLYNFCEQITTHVVIAQCKPKKHTYQVNYTMAICICRNYLKSSHRVRPPDVEILIKQNILPIRPERIAPRKIRMKKSISFLYRVS